MINMKQSRKGETLLAETEASEQPEYPYGLRIHLDQESLAKLGITEMPEVGKTFTLQAHVQVVSVSQYENDEGKSREMGLQITDMDLKQEGGESDAKSLYPNSNMI